MLLHTSYTITSIALTESDHFTLLRICCGIYLLFPVWGKLKSPARVPFMIWILVSCQFRIDFILGSGDEQNRCGLIQFWM
jgi:hypothetical protein